MSLREPPGTDTAGPYPGLRPFRADEAGIFFGRETQTSELLSKLERNRFLAVVGPSGCGKSSLVRCGMVAALRSGFLAEAGARWRIAEMRPGEQPLARLAAALCDPKILGRDRGSDALAVGMLEATLRGGPRGLLEALRETPLAEATNLLVLVDQFEEIFRYRAQASVDEADAFVALLLATAAQRDLPVYIVITMRADFLGDCALFHDLPAAINDAQYLTPRLTREQIRSAIVGPARVYGADVDPGLVNRLINEVGPDPDQLPLLQHALMRMWSHLQERLGPDEARAPEAVAVIGEADYCAVGSLAEALSFHADQTLAELGGAEKQRIAQVLFTRLTERAQGQRDIRRPCRVGEIAAVAGVESAVVAEVIEPFRRPDRSFLMPPPPTPITPDTLVDIGHESLIRQWKALAGWVEAEARDAATYRHLARSANRWKEGRLGLLDQESDLREPIKWRETYGRSAEWALRYGPLQAFDNALEFLERSEQAARGRARQTKRNRILWVWGVAATTVMVLASVAAVWAHRLNDQLAELTQQARSRELSIRARSAPEIDRSIELGLQALKAADPPTPEAIAVLRQVVQRAGVVAARRWPGEVTRVLMTRDGSTVVTLHDDHALRVWEIGDPGKAERLLSSPGEQWSEVRLAENASRIVADSAGEIAVWDRATGARVGTFAGAYAGLSEDGTRIASLNDGVVELRRAADGGLISAFGKDVRRLRLGTASGSLALTIRDRNGKSLLQVWDTDRGVEVPAFARRALAADDAHITAGKPGLVVVRHAGRVDAFDRGTAKPVWSSPRELAIEGAEPSPSGERLMTWGQRADAQGAEDERWVSIIELPGGKEVRSQRYSGRILEADWGFEERTVLVQAERRAPASGANGLEWTKTTISLWNVRSGRRTAIPVSKWSETYASADRRWQIATGTDGTVRVVDGISGDVLTTIDSQSGPIRKSDFTPDGRMLAVGDAQGVVQVFELPSLGTGAALARDGRKAFPAERRTVMFARDGANALGIDVDGRLTLWSTDAPAAARIHAGGQIVRARMDGVGRRVAIADRFGESQRIRLLDRAGAEHWSFALREYESLEAVELSHDGGRVVVAKGMPGGRVRAQVFEFTGQGDARTLGAFEYAADDRSTPPLAFAPDGRFVATGDADGRVRIWDAETGALVRGRGAHESQVRQLIFDPESRHLVSVGGDGRIQMWSTLDWTMRELPARHRSVVFHVAFSADGTRFLSVGKDNLIRVADPARAAHLADIRLTKTGIVDAQFSGDGKWIVTATEDRYIRVWDAVLGEQIAEFRGPEEPAAVAFAPNGTEVIAIDRSAVQWRFMCRGCAPADEIQSTAVRMGRILAAVADPKQPPSASRDE